MRPLECRPPSRCCCCRNRRTSFLAALLPSTNRQADSFLLHEAPVVLVQESISCSERVNSTRRRTMNAIFIPNQSVTNTVILEVSLDTIAVNDGIATADEEGCVIWVWSHMDQSTWRKGETVSLLTSCPRDFFEPERVREPLDMSKS